MSAARFVDWFNYHSPMWFDDAVFAVRNRWAKARYGVEWLDVCCPICGDERFAHAFTRFCKPVAAISDNEDNK